MSNYQRRAQRYEEPPRRRRRKPRFMLYFFAAIGVVATLVCLARYVLIPLLVSLQMMGGGVQ